MHRKKAHPAVECIQDHGDADKVVRRVVRQILPELADICVDLQGRNQSAAQYPVKALDCCRQHVVKRSHGC